MILAIDVGNTNIVIGCIEGEKVRFVERVSTNLSKTELEYVVEFKTLFDIYGIGIEDISGSIISSVVPPLNNILRSAMEKLLHSKPLLVGPGLKTGLNILMDNPAQVGSDLIADAVGAIAEYQAPLIIFDMGTATTVCVVDSKKNYIGGMILPGVRTALDALTARAAQLSGIDLVPPKRIIGKNTVECMRSGVLNSNAATVDGLITRIQDEMGCKATVVATGGLAKSIIPYCREKVILDDDLLLKGLRIIYEKNK